jgi:hypothetical protein
MAEVEEGQDLAEETAGRQTKTKGSKKKSKAKTAKAAKTAGKAKASRAKGGVKKVGVIDSILESICAENGASMKEICDKLEKKFPDRERKSMETTARIQVTRLPKRLNFTLKKTKDEKRGLVYKAPVSALKTAAKNSAAE